MGSETDLKNLSDGQVEVLKKILSICEYLDFARTHKVADGPKLEQAERLGFLWRDFEKLRLA